MAKKYFIQIEIIGKRDKKPEQIADIQKYVDCKSEVEFELKNAIRILNEFKE